MGTYEIFSPVFVELPIFNPALSIYALIDIPVKRNRVVIVADHI
jgi:hypothetical protein